MKVYGIVRKVDELGRITIPAEIRESFGLQPHDKVEIIANGDHIKISKVKTSDTDKEAILRQVEILFNHTDNQEVKVVMANVKNFMKERY